MCFGGGDTGAGALRDQANRQQALDNAAVQQIQAIFQGGSAPQYTPAGGQAFDPNATYYARQGTNFVPEHVKPTGQAFAKLPGTATYDPNATYYNFTPGHGTGKFPTGGAGPGQYIPGGYSPAKGVNAGDFAAMLAKGLYGQSSTGKVPAGTWLGTKQTYPGFGDDFYKQRQQAYLDWAVPQFNQQLAGQQQGLQGQLNDRGLLGSSAGQQQADTLSGYANAQRQGLSNQAISQSQALQQQLAGQEANLISEAQAATNPAGAITSALQTAASFSGPATFQPLGNLFGQFANQYLGSQVGATPSYSALYPFLQGAASPYGSSQAWLPGNQGG